MSIYKCECGNDGFKVVNDDVYYLELDVNEDEFMTVKVTDKDVLGDIEASTIVCDKCGKTANPNYEDSEWNWDAVQ